MLPLLFLSLLDLAASLNVLIFIPGTTDWEKRPFMRIAQDLTFRNHVTSTFKGVIIPEQRYLVKQKVHGARELSMLTGVHADLVDELKAIGNKMPFTKDYDSLWYAEPRWAAHANACDTVLNSDLMGRFQEDKFDVALVYSGNPCNLALVWSLNIPFIYFDTEGLTDETVFAAGMPANPATIPSSLSTFGPDMGFWDRWANMALYGREWAAASGVALLSRLGHPRVRFLDAPVVDIFAADYEIRKLHPSFPSVAEMASSAALFFANSDPVVEWAGRPSVPNLVYVGGQQAEYPKPLFHPYNTTNARGRSGVIVFSFGTVANSSAMPRAWRDAFVDAFTKLDDFQVYWLTGTADDVFDIPPNVNLTLFLPQLDLLAADETRLLITNGGMDSVMEAVTCAVPILGIPLYGVNYNSLRKVETRGMAKILDKADLSADTIYKAVREVTGQAKYRLSAVRLSRALKDRPLTPYETLIYWVEFVGRNRGAPLLARPPLPPLAAQLYLDAAAVAVLLFALLSAALKALCRLTRGKAPLPMPAKAATDATKPLKRRKATKAD